MHPKLISSLVNTNSMLTRPNLFRLHFLDWPLEKNPTDHLNCIMTPRQWPAIMLAYFVNLSVVVVAKRYHVGK